MSKPTALHERAARLVCEALEGAMRQAGVVTTAHYEAGVPLVAQALADAEASARRRCAEAARGRKVPDDGTLGPEDASYNDACDDVAAAVEAEDAPGAP